MHVMSCRRWQGAQRLTLEATVRDHAVLGAIIKAAAQRSWRHMMQYAESAEQSALETVAGDHAVAGAILKADVRFGKVAQPHREPALVVARRLHGWNLEAC